MDQHTQNYLSYLRDCVRLVNRASPIDFNARSNQGEILPLSAADIRQIEATQSLQTNDAIIMRWKRELQISAEGECHILLGFMLLAGKQDQTKFCCPLLIAETDVSSQGDNETRLDIKPGTLRLYTPALSMLLAEREDSDSELIAEEIEKIGKDAPVSFPFGNDIEKLIRSLHNALKQDRRPPFSSKSFVLRSIEEDVLREARNGSRLTLLSTVAALKIDALPDFSVEKEISEIIKAEIADGTALPLLIRQIGQVSTNSQIQETGNATVTSPSRVLEVLTLSRRQKEAIAFAKDNPLTVIAGPPGTGKSHTIASMAINLAYSGETVLITSKTREAVSVVVDKLQQLGGRYVVAHVGDKFQKKEFASLIKGILEYEQLDRVKVTKELKQAQEELQRVQQDKQEVSRVIKKLETYYGQYHSARAYLEKLADTEIPEIMPSLRELGNLREKAEWVRRALARPMPSFAHKLRSRALLSEIKTNLRLKQDNGCGASLDSVNKCYHTKTAEEALSVLKQQKNIRTLWKNHAELVDRELEKSRKVFECWRRFDLATVLYTDKENTSPRLRNYANALESPVTKSKARLVSKILEGTDSSLLLRCFPIWACTSNHLSQALKLEPALFDYAIIDEASLCDPATAIPALFRARRVIVVGDEKQLKHRLSIADAKLQMLATKNELDSLTINDLNYKRSVYEISASRVSKDGLFMLDEHFRSLPPIIEFSNQKYYEGRLKVMRRNPINERANSIEFHYVQGTRDERKVIPEEYDKALELIREILNQDQRVRLGVITMTEEQARYMNARFSEEDIVGTLLSECSFKCGSPQSFQGDQRHTIILCLGIDSEAHQMTVAHALQDNRFNVAVTRAEDRMIVISSISPSAFIGNIREYYDHSLGLSRKSLHVDKACFDSNFEREVYETLVSEDMFMNIHPQYESCGYKIDFVVTRGDRFIAVEVDGPQHFDDKGNYVARDVERSLRLTRGGWIIERISCYDWEHGLPARREFIQRVKNALA